MPGSPEPEETERLRADACFLSHRLLRRRRIQPAQILVDLLAAIDDGVIHFPLCSQQWLARYVAFYDGRGPHIALDHRTLDDACFNGLQLAAAPWPAEPSFSKREERSDRAEPPPGMASH